MPNLIQQIGADYFRRRFQLAFFRDDGGHPAVLQSMHDGRSVETQRVIGDVDRVTTENRMLPATFFDSLERFTVPPLGWRCAYQGKLMVHLQRNNSSYDWRGTGFNNIITHFAPLTSALQDDGLVNTDLTPAQMCALTFNDAFMSLQQGVDEIRAGRRLGFAISPTVAVSVKNEDTLEVYFRQFAVGTIDGSNRMKISVPYLQHQIGELR